jgi:hypothetical protein
MSVYAGEIYGKQTASKLVMYNVIKVTKTGVTLQNIDNPLSLFEITPHKLHASGYLRLSQTPFIDVSRNKKKSLKKPTRCPYTLDFLEARADVERPAPIMPDMFGA